MTLILTLTLTLTLTWCSESHTTQPHEDAMITFGFKVAFALHRPVVSACWLGLDLVLMLGLRVRDRDKG